LADTLVAGCIIAEGRVVIGSGRIQIGVYIGHALTRRSGNLSIIPVGDRRAVRCILRKRIVSPVTDHHPGKIRIHGARPAKCNLTRA